jgi:uncharacterized protein (DUF983 family)
MYLDKNPYNLGNIYKMHENCSHCGQLYKIEPSFFYGAMYVSYGLGVAVSIASFIVAFVLIGTSLKTSFFVIIATLVALMPVTMRLSRNIWINVFIRYDKNWKALKDS